MSWTDERVELLKKLWGDGLSASQIAGELGEVTRNAVIGKVHRLGLSGRAKTAPTAARPRKPMREAEPRRDERPQRPMTHGNTALAPSLEQMVQEAPAPAPQSADNVVPMGQRCTIMNLTESTCRWPMGEPGTDGFYFCGGKTKQGLPYCAHHARIAYQPVQDRRRDRRLAYLA
ncbi:GcrA family cell cycle regulator [Xanthobacter tagetidis]|jgi:GcrA cell cycle regulator|uniref:GcrA cell cycle regulator n=1 Tax=Xanthobacter tagetidis TaxID=60216 RepID=A0A3L7AN31_9HYPH|nr:GcrA family cell cycle regulator [Xanthobacter tagetidis]MBB6308122.1 GcrA cell cycle regulator [Xanthobacter tagetidis]RLP81747.1 GcrA cell cycle regulator [Xanthobacter tagetidis]